MFLIPKSMNHKMISAIGITFLFFITFYFPLHIQAQQNPIDQAQNQTDQTQNPGPEACTDPDSCLLNPIKSDSINGLVLSIIDVILLFLLPIIIIYIMYAGFLFVTARGNPEQIKKAREALLWAIIGGVIVLGAKLIVEVVQGTIDQFSA